MDLSSKQLADLISGMRNAYARDENAMAYAREALRTQGVVGRNHRLASLIAYDLQAGTYAETVRANPQEQQRWCRQLADLIAPVLPKDGSLLEVGVGEATTLAGVLTEFGWGGRAFGFDVSWSRIKVANDWLREQSQVAELFVGDLFNIPISDNSIDVVYSSHSLEPNGGWEEEAIAECLRVARKAVVLIEPIYELASPEAQARMEHHGYVRGLKEAALSQGATVSRYHLLSHCAETLNPSGVILIEKDVKQMESTTFWRCPLTHEPLKDSGDAFAAINTGIVYPVLRGIPMLMAEHAVIASKCN